MNEPMWQPTAEVVEKANMTAFLHSANERWQIDLKDYRALYRWSIEEPARFWQSIWEFCRIIASHPPEEVVVDAERMPGARWFPGARLNFAENLLRFRDERRALVFWNETGFVRSLSFAELYGQVARVADALRRMGLKPGDRVAGFLPNL